MLFKINEVVRNSIPVTLIKPIVKYGSETWKIQKIDESFFPRF